MARSLAPWTAAEDHLVQLYYPDYSAICVSLPERTYHALRNRVRALGIQKTRRRWTTVDVKKYVRGRQAGLSLGQMLPEFPGVTKQQLQRRMAAIALVSKRLRPLDDPLLDDIRLRATAARLSLRDLDRLAKSGRYFQRCNRTRVARHLARAVLALGGQVDVTWEPLE